MVATGRLEQRLRFYARTENGADGLTRPVYVFSVERWGRVDVMADQETVPLAPQAHAEYRATAIATVMDYVAIPAFGLVKHDGLLYWIRGIVPIRQLRQKNVMLELIDPTQYATFVLTEPESVTDGVHLVDPS